MAESQSESEYMTVAEAREYLGVSKAKMTRLLDDGILPSEPNVLDKRSKLVRRVDVEALRKVPGMAARKSAA